MINLSSIFGHNKIKQGKKPFSLVILLSEDSVILSILANRTVLYSILFALLLSPTAVKTSFAQEMLGIMNSNYSGITGALINPASPVTSPFYLDVNIVSANVFVENNYVYLAKEEYRFKRFFESNPQFPTHGIDNDLILYDYYNRKDKEAYSNIRVMGPSVSVTIGRHAFGIITGARTVVSAINVPYEIAKFGFETRKFPPQYDVNYVDSRNMYLAGLAWAENGINYSYQLFNRGLDYWVVGATVKDLRGYGGGYLFMNSADYIVLDQDTLIVHNANAEAGFSLPVNFQTSAFEQNPLFRGKGLGFDIGVVYQKKKRNVRNEHFKTLCAQPYVQYYYRIGVSLLDIGRIRFTKNAERLVFEDVSTYWPDLGSTDFQGIDNITQLLSNQFYGNPTQALQGNEIKIGLPTALSIQADMNYRKNWFLNGTLVYPLQFSKTGLRRPSIIAISPRFETRTFEMSMPLSLYNFTKPRIGLSARFRGFYIGTEKLSGYFHLNDFTGIDLYFGLKFSLRKGNCRSSGMACGNEEYKKFVKKTKRKKRK